MYTTARDIFHTSLCAWKTLVCIGLRSFVVLFYFRAVIGASVRIGVSAPPYDKTSENMATMMSFLSLRLVDHARPYSSSRSLMLHEFRRLTRDDGFKPVAQSEA